jgi:hypothetical protein
MKIIQPLGMYHSDGKKVVEMLQVLKNKPKSGHF